MKLASLSQNARNLLLEKMEVPLLENAYFLKERAQS
jgi:hypothetical protein